MKSQAEKLWGWMQIDIPRTDEGNRLRIVMGAVGLTREEARAGVQGLLDAWPHLAEAAATWSAGHTTDDYLYNNALSSVAIFAYEPHQDPLDGANQWMAWFVRERARKYDPKIYVDPIGVTQGVVEPEHHPELTASPVNHAPAGRTHQSSTGGWWRRRRH
ncbi:hypothetical protein ACQP2X_39680 [Actinoplanes sp. CA-131856]